MDDNGRWVAVLDAKIGKYNKDDPPCREFLRYMKFEIDEWNAYAIDPKQGYERKTRELKWIAPETTVELAIPYFNRDSVVLDLGCGTGLVGRKLIERGYIVDGVDFSREMLKVSKNRGYNNIVCADLRQFDLKELLPNRYRSLISVGVFGDFVSASWLKHELEVMDETCVVVISGDIKKLDGHVKRELTNEGFSIVDEHTNIAHYRDKGTPVEYLYVVASR